MKLILAQALCKIFGAVEPTMYSSNNGRSSVDNNGFQLLLINVRLLIFFRVACIID